MSSPETDAVKILEQATLRWRAIFETAQDAIICTTDTGEVTLFNPAAERIFGYRAEEVVGRNVRMLMPQPYRAEHDDYLRRYRDTGEAKAIGRLREVRGQRRNGEPFPIELSVSEVKVGADTLYNAIVRDVTERERARADHAELTRRLAQKERLADIGVVTARIVHDLGNPLAGLLMTAQQVQRSIDRDPARPAEALRASAARLVATARRLDVILGDFKDFARDQQLDLRPVELSRFLDDVASFWRPEAELRRVTLTVDAPADLTIRIDPEKCQRVFDNLVKNALEAVDRGPGAVRVQAARLTDTKVRISVRDSGPGVPEGLDVFALFETTKPNGTGLGLSACKQIVLAHGGGIDFAPAEPHGAIFFVDLFIDGPRAIPVG